MTLKTKSSEIRNHTIPSLSEAVSLSGKQSFYRTIPNNEVVAKAYIPLCKHFGWNKIAIVYINDAYGTDLKDQIEIEAKTGNIDVESIPFEYSFSNSTTREESMEGAADLIKKLELYIIIIISSGNDLRFVMDQFKANGILEYPYYYILRTAPNSIEAQGLGNLTQGFIAVQESFPALLTKQQYIDFNVYDGNLTIWEISNNIYSEIKNKWLEIYNNDPSIVYYVAEPHAYVAWGYDSAYVVALTLNYLIESGFDLFDYNATKFIEAIKYYLVNELSFIGATGHVAMDKNGDRLHGYYTYGYIDNDGEFELIGVYGLDGNISINDNITIYFPNYFDGKASPKPLSSPLTHITSIGVDESVYWTVITLCIVFMILIIICIILMLKERKHPIIAISSYKLNIMVSCGCILVLFIVSIQRTGDFGCILIWYGYSVPFTLIFMPVFKKLYQVHIVMRGNVDFDMMKEKGKKMNKAIVAMISLDLILFFILTTIHFVNGNIL